MARPAASLIYRWYTNRLLTDVRSHPVPEHVAIILDGNRRFALLNGMADRGDGHRYGAQKVSQVIQWCDELEIPVVTLWAFSTDNFSRTPEELDKLFQVVNEKLDEFREQKGAGANRRVRAVGRIEMLPEDTRERIRDVERLTASVRPWLLNVAVAYGGRAEIVDAFRRAVRSRADAGESAADIAESFSDADLTQNLYAPDVADPELIIRTSGELRLSGFLLWQSVHSELYFCDALWPAFRKLDLLRAIRSYQARHRRFGR